MSIPLNELVVSGFNKMREWGKNHPRFPELLEKKKREGGWFYNKLVENTLDYYFTHSFSCTEILKMLEEAIEEGHITEVECSTTKALRAVLSDKTLEELKKEEIGEEDKTKLQNYLNFFYGLYLRNLDLA